MRLGDPTIFWHVYPLGATGAPLRPTDATATDGVVHRLPRLAAWLDYAADLGCTALLLGPIFASRSHGYDTLDHFRIDPRLGDEADFDRLVAAAAARGMGVVLDGVFNHVGRDHPLVGQSLSAGGGPVRLSWHEGVAYPYGWEGHADLAELDHADPRTVDLVTDVMRHWLRRGVAGWRLDVAYAVPSAFWREVLGRVRAEFPDAYFLGEVIHGDYPALAQAGTLDAVTQYELWKAIWSALLDSNLWELAWALGRHEEFVHRAGMQTFVGNHDVDRIASVVGDPGAALAAVVLLTVPGTPSIYYGDEQAFRGRKGRGIATDDPLRPQLPDRPDDLDPHGWWLYRLYQQLTGLRRANPWLTRAHLEVLGRDTTWIEYECRGDGHSMRVRLELVPTAQARVHVDGAEVLAWSGPAD